MRLLFLNQYFPPDPAPTGILFREIADEMSRTGHEVDFLDAGEVYRAGQGKRGRLWREFSALRRMFKKGKSSPRADVVISGTSPPCLAWVAQCIAKKHRARHIHWAMDLYPEIAVALGEIGEKSLLSRILEHLMGWAYRRCQQVVALDADMAMRLSKYGVDAVCIRPWVFKTMLASPILEAPANGQWTWIYSGNLGRAHDFETLLLAQQELERAGEDIRLLFQGGGPGWPLAQARARELDLRHCVFRAYAAEEKLQASLLECHAMVVTQRPETQGMLWPSKLGLLTALPRAIAFVGPMGGAIAMELRKMPHVGVFANGDARSLALWLKSKRRQPQEKIHPLDASQHRQEMLEKWRSLLGRIPTT